MSIYACIQLWSMKTHLENTDRVEERIGKPLLDHTNCKVIGAYWGNRV